MSQVAREDLQRTATPSLSDMPLEMLLGIMSSRAKRHITALCTNRLPQQATGDIPIVKPNLRSYARQTYASLVSQHRHHPHNNDISFSSFSRIPEAYSDNPAKSVDTEHESKVWPSNEGWKGKQQACIGTLSLNPYYCKYMLDAHKGGGSM